MFCRLCLPTFHSNFCEVWVFCNLASQGPQRVEVKNLACELGGGGGLLGFFADAGQAEVLSSRRPQAQDIMKLFLDIL